MISNNIKAILSLTLDKSSLPQIKKQLLKEKLTLNVTLDTNALERLNRLASREVYSLTHLTKQCHYLLAASMSSFYDQQQQYLKTGSKLTYQAANISKISSDLRTPNNASSSEEINAKYNVNISDYGISAKDILKSSLSDTKGNLINLTAGMETAGIGIAATLVTTALEAGLQKLNEWIHRQEIAIQKGKEAANTIDAIKDSLEKKIKCWILLYSLISL